jgi:hypothetical protein
MEVIIRYPSGQRIEGVVLAVGKFLMRIALHNTDDTIELCQSYGQWADETGCPVEFESFLAGDHVDLNSALAETRPLALAAGRMRDRESVAPASPMANSANHVA